MGNYSIRGWVCASFIAHAEADGSNTLSYAQDRDGDGITTPMLVTRLTREGPYIWALKLVGPK